ncbi:MAG: hypothetical protein H7318_20230 [Oligoflexus sp.]|nr:hypothetical protein [Oligoflexus sp.]
MQRRLQSKVFFLIIFGYLAFSSCGKKKSDPAVATPNPSDIPSDWDLNSDYPATDLKAKDL